MRGSRLKRAVGVQFLPWRVRCPRRFNCSAACDSGWSSTIISRARMMICRSVGFSTRRRQSADSPAFPIRGRPVSNRRPCAHSGIPALGEPARGSRIRTFLGRYFGDRLHNLETPCAHRFVFRGYVACPRNRISVPLSNGPPEWTAGRRRGSFFARSPRRKACGGNSPCAPRNRT